MAELYPPESRKLDVINHLEEFRKRILYSLAVICISAVVCFFFGDRLMGIAAGPIRPYVGSLVFLSPTEAFVSYVKIALLSGLFVSFPFLLFQVWGFLAPAFGTVNRRRILAWLSGGCLLFYGGVIFAYYLAIPAALRFLISFGSNIARAEISIGRYISFVSALIFAGGLIFEIPVIMGLSADLGLIRSSVMREKRKFAVIVILVLAAVITPTQDIMNMLLFSLPMLLLYEVGLLIAVIMEKSRKGSP
jgi:sec-independent protein translocase protein TatC